MIETQDLIGFKELIGSGKILNLIITHPSMYSIIENIIHLMPTSFVISKIKIKSSSPKTIKEETLLNKMLKSLKFTSINHKINL